MWKWAVVKYKHIKIKPRICILFILCLTWTVNANSLKQNIIVYKEICSWLPPFCKQNLLLFIQPRWQLRRTCVEYSPAVSQLARGATAGAVRAQYQCASRCRIPRLAPRGAGPRPSAGVVICSVVVKTSRNKTKTKTAEFRSRTISRPRARSRGLQDWLSVWSEVQTCIWPS